MSDVNISIDKLSDKDRKMQIAEIIIMRYRRGGYRLPNNDALFDLIDDVVDMLLEHFPQITIIEIRKALESGFSGKYGELRAGIYADKVLSYVRAYKEEMGANVKTNCQALYTEDQRPVTEKDIKDLVSTIYKLHRENKVISYCNGLLFDDLYYLRLIDIDAPPQSFINKAIETVKNETIKQMRHGNEYDRTGLIESLGQISANDANIINKAKDLYVKDYFDSLITQNVDVNYLLIDKHISQEVLNFKNRTK